MKVRWPNMPQDKTLKKHWVFGCFEALLFLGAQKQSKRSVFCTVYENRRFQTDALNDVFFSKMLRKPCVWRCIFMVEVKSTRDSRRRRLHEIVTTPERELHFDVFHLKFKSVFFLSLTGKT